MKAIFQTQYGKGDVLQYGEQSSPSLKPDQVRVDNHAASVSVTAEWASLGLLALHIIIELVDGNRFDQVFESPLG